MKKTKHPQLLTPQSVKAIISKIKDAQQTRAQEDISSQLSDILGNVNSIISQFQRELGSDLKEKAKYYQTGPKGKNRFVLLEKIASFSKDAKMKEKHLYEILHWLGDWGDSLAYEMKNRKSEEEEESMDKWIEVVEKMLPLSLIATKGGIESLISLCSTLIEEKKKKEKLSKHSFWQNWQEKSLKISTLSPQPLSPEQMLQDKQIICTKISEVKSMLDELLNATIFSQGEIKAIRYMSSVVENLKKALILQHQENKSLENKYKCLKTKMVRELSSQRLHFLKSIQALKQAENVRGKYHDLLLVKHNLELQLKKMQTARVQMKEVGQVSVDSLDSPEKEPLPKEKTVLEASKQEEQQLTLPLHPHPVVVAWDSDESLPIMTAHSKIALVYSSKGTQTLEPVLMPSAGQKFPKKWEMPKAEVKSPDLEHKDLEDLSPEVDQEKARLQGESSLKQQLYSESSTQTAVLSPLEHCEEELSRQVQRQQWLEEEELWQQKQKKWELMEQEHHEKLRQWVMEEEAREQQQKLVQLEKEQGSPRKELEQLKGDAETVLFTTTNQWKDLKEESLPPPPQAPSQPAQQGRRSHLPRSPNTPQLTRRNQRTSSSARCAQKPRTYQIPKAPQKSASLPITGTLVPKVPQPALLISQVTLKGRIYHMDTKTLRKNLQLLDEESSAELPCYLRNRVLELTNTIFELTELKLQCLCIKYIHYRHFQSLRQEIIKHIQSMRVAGTPYKAQHISSILENLDHMQNVRLQACRDRQKVLEKLRQDCLSSMVTLLPKLKLEWNIQLHSPVVIAPQSQSRKSKPLPSLLQCGHASGTSYRRSQEQFKIKPQDCVAVQMACTPSKQEIQVKGIWKTDVASSSHPIEKKIPTSLTWDQVGGHPDVPRLLALDIHSFYHKSLMSLKAW